MAKDDMILDLSTLTDNVVSDDINEYSITLYGEGGSGKSTFANALKRKVGSSVSFFFEPRAKGLGGIKVVECMTWDMFLKYIKQLRKYKKDGTAVPFDNIIIDSVDSAYDKCTKYVLDNNPDWNGSLSGDYGARYNVVGKEFKDAISALRTLGFIVTFLTHEKSKEAHDVNNAAFEKASPIVAGQIQDIVNDQVDFIMYLQKVTVEDDNGERKEMRRLWLKNTPYITLKTPIYGLPDYIDYEEVNEGVEKFLKAFYNGVEITRARYENGEDVSNPNEENNAIYEESEPVTSNILTEDEPAEEEIEVDDEFDDEEEVADDDNELSVEDLQKEAIAIRDTLLQEKTTDEVKIILKSALGKVKISAVDDTAKLLKFIRSYK